MTSLLFSLALAQANLEVGMEAPDFTLRDQSGAVHSLRDYRGKTVLLMFYPKDETSGCSCQARAARDVLPSFTAKNVVILSINSDGIDSHAAFARKEGLNYPLLSDPEKSVIRRYGALGENGLARRITFVINGVGRIVGVDRAVDATFQRSGGELKTTHLSDMTQFLSDWKPVTGERVPNFWLTDADGRTVSVRPHGSAASAIVFLDSTEASRHYLGSLEALFADPAYRRVSFVAVDPQRDGATIPPLAARGRLNWANDPLGTAIPRFAVALTPSAWIIDGGGIVRYAGPLDRTSDAREAKARLLREALLAVMSGRPVSNP